MIPAGPPARLILANTLWILPMVVMVVRAELHSLVAITLWVIPLAARVGVCISQSITCIPTVIAHLQFIVILTKDTTLS